MDPAVARVRGDLLRTAAQDAPDAEAFRYRGERLTYGDWDALADRTAAALAARGIGRGDVVALLLPSTPFYLVAYLGAARLGAITTGINVRYRRTEIGHILGRSGAALLLAVERWHDADFRGAVEGLRPGLPELREVVWYPAARLAASTAGAVADLGGSGAPPAVAVAPDDPVAIVFTSGTTGVPKGACFTHRNLLAVAEIEARRYPRGAAPAAKHLAAGLSFAHVGTTARIAIQLSERGATLIHDAFDPAAVLETIERERLDALGGIPTQVIMLLDHPDRARRDLSSLRSVLLGGAPSSPALIRRVHDTLGVEVSVRYSSTEVAIATASLPDDPTERLATTVGKPTPGVELRIVDERNAPVPAGTSGEVVVRSPAAMVRYWRDPEATAATIDADGWVHTGDVGVHARPSWSALPIGSRGGPGMAVRERLPERLGTLQEGTARRARQRRRGRHGHAGGGRAGRRRGRRCQGARHAGHRGSSPAGRRGAGGRGRRRSRRRAGRRGGGRGRGQRRARASRRRGGRPWQRAAAAGGRDARRVRGRH